MSMMEVKNMYVNLMVYLNYWVNGKCQEYNFRVWENEKSNQYWVVSCKMSKNIIREYKQENVLQGQ